MSGGVHMELVRDIPLANQDREKVAEDQPVRPPLGVMKEFKPVPLYPDSDYEYDDGDAAPLPEDDLAEAPGGMTEEVSGAREESALALRADVAKTMGGAGIALSTDGAPEKWDVVAPQDTTQAAPGDKEDTSQQDRHTRPGKWSGRSRPREAKAPKDEPAKEIQAPPAEEAAFSGGGDGAGDPPEQGPPDTGGEGDPERARQWSFYKDKVHEPFVNEYRLPQAAPQEMDDVAKEAAIEMLRQVDGMIRSGERPDTTVTATGLPVMSLEEKIASENREEFADATQVPDEDAIRAMLDAAKRETEIAEEEPPTEAPVLPLKGIYAAGHSAEKEFPTVGERTGMPVLVSLHYYQNLRTPPGYGETTVALYSYEKNVNIRRNMCVYSITTEPRGENAEPDITSLTVRRQMRGGDGVVYIPNIHEIAGLRKVLAACQYVYEH